MISTIELNSLSLHLLLFYSLAICLISIFFFYATLSSSMGEMMLIIHPSILISIRCLGCLVVSYVVFGLLILVGVGLRSCRHCHLQNHSNSLLNYPYHEIQASVPLILVSIHNLSHQNRLYQLIPSSDLLLLCQVRTFSTCFTSLFHRIVHQGLRSLLNDLFSF